MEQQSRRIKHFRSQGQCKGCHQLDECAENVGWIDEIEQVGFQVTTKCNIFCSFNLITEKPRVPAYVLSLGTASKLKLDDRSCLCCLAGVSIESKCGNCLDERAW